MKILLLFALIFVFALNYFGSPLVFKGTKEIKEASASAFAEVLSFNTAKYREVRIAIEKQSIETKKIEQTRGFRVYAVEGSGDVFLQYIEGYTGVLTTPPSQIKIKISEPGLYNIYVWAE